MSCAIGEVNLLNFIYVRQLHVLNVELCIAKADGCTRRAVCTIASSPDVYKNPSLMKRRSTLMTRKQVKVMTALM